MSEQKFCRNPFTLDSCRGNIDNRGYLFDGHSGKKLHFNDSGLPGVEIFEFHQCFIDGEYVQRSLLIKADGSVKVDLRLVFTAALNAAFGSCIGRSRH